MVINEFIDFFTKDELSLPFNLLLDTKSKTHKETITEIENISIKEAFINCNENLIKDYFQEILAQKTIGFCFSPQRDTYLEEEKSSLILLKDMIASRI